MLVALDVLLCAGLLATAWRLLSTRDLFYAVLFFIVFGLLLALVWARLRAVDVALAEAAIGAGLTGALLISAVSRLTGSKRGNAVVAPPGPTSPIGQVLKAQGTRRIALGVLSISVTGTLVWAIAGLPPAPERLRGEVLGRLGTIGIDNPVTAVLLDFRGYDTLLEIGVLLLAVAVLWSVARRGQSGPIESAGSLLDGLTRLLIPVAVLVASYLLWRGADHPGGAFQAGAVLAGAGVLMTLAWPATVHRLGDRTTMRLAMALGSMVFLAVGLGTALRQGFFLSYPPGQAPTLMLVIETGVMISVAAILLALFLGERPSVNERGDPDTSRNESEA